MYEGLESIHPCNLDWTHSARQATDSGDEEVDLKFINADHGS